MIKYITSGNVGNCLNCGSALTVEEIETPIRNNYYVICNSCGRIEYFTGTIKEKK